MSSARFILAALLLALSLSFSARGAHAQAPDSLRVVRVLRSACPGPAIRLAVQDGRLLEGRCGAVTDGRLLVTVAGTQAHVPVGQISSVWTQRTYATEGAIVLGGLGFAAGLQMGRGPGNCFGLSECDSDDGNAVLTSAVGAFVGVLAGRYVGSRIRGWVRQVP